MFSVALCTYNGEKFLKEQLQSIANQTVAPHEMIVCDDGSSDRTIEILESFQKQAHFDVKIFRSSQPLGVTRNFEKAIRLCSGHIVFLSDQDDIWKPNKIARISNFFSENKQFQAVFTNGDLIQETGVLLNKTLWDAYEFLPATQERWKNGEVIKDLLYNRNKVTGATLAIRKELCAIIFPFDHGAGLFHDRWIALQAAATNSLGWIPESLIFYRIHPAQQVGIKVKQAAVPHNSLQETEFTLGEVLKYQEAYYEEFLQKTDSFLKQFPSLDRQELRKDAFTHLSFIKFRSNLPVSALARFTRILLHYKKYRQYTHIAVRSMIRDLLKPARMAKT